MMKIELTRHLLEQAIEQKLASLKRGINTSNNPMIVEIYRKEQAEYQTALNTMTEVTK